MTRTVADQNMKNPILDIHRITVKALPVYHCGECGAQTFGQTVRIDIDTDGCHVEQALALVAQHPISAQHLPFGWSNSYRSDGDVVRCVNCTHRRHYPTDSGETRV